MTTSTETADAGVEDQEPEASEASAIGPSSTIKQIAEMSTNEGNESKIPAGDRKIVISPGRNSKGPRSSQGKARSKYNALKHGIFAKVVLLSFEPQSELNALSWGLERDLAPQGTLEEILVEKLATLFWRYRRFLQAESAELKRNIQLEQIERLRRSDRLSDFAVLIDSYFAQTDKGGLISSIADLTVLRTCLDRLRGVRTELEKFGLDHDTHRIVLGRIYGARYEGRPAEDLFDLYLNCLGASQASEEERRRRRFQSKEECLKRCLAATEQEICRLEILAKQSSFTAAAAKQPLQPVGEEILRCTIPNAAEMERLTRYESNIERAIHRTLEQLERLQHLRFARAVPRTKMLPASED